MNAAVQPAEQSTGHAPPLVEARNLSISYGAKRAVDDVSFVIWATTAPARRR